jgi:acyl-coenzyme A thioesterase PaaI-like protein
MIGSSRDCMSGSGANCAWLVASSISAVAHAHRVICSPSNERVLRLKFSTNADSSMQADLVCDQVFEGYADILHGGAVATLPADATTKCSFAHGQPAATAEFTTRFRHPARTGSTVTVRPWTERCSPPPNVLEAEVVQGGEIKAAARGKFADPAHASEP